MGHLLNMDFNAWQDLLLQCSYFELIFQNLPSNTLKTYFFLTAASKGNIYSYYSDISKIFFTKAQCKYQNFSSAHAALLYNVCALPNQ